MKIYVKSNDTKHPIKLFFPNSILKSKFIYNMILKGDIDEVTKKKILKIRKVLYKEINAFIRFYGHFTLVEVDAKDGTKVRIKV